MIYLDKFLHFISADGHHYKVPSSFASSSLSPRLMVEGRPFQSYNPTSHNGASKPLPLVYFSSSPGGLPCTCNLDNVARRWTGSILISGKQGPVSVESVDDTSFRMPGAGMTEANDPYFGYKVYIEFYDEYFQLKTISDWIEWAYQSQNGLTHRQRTVNVTLEGDAQYVKIRLSCFQSADVTDSGPHVDYASDYIRIIDVSQIIDSTSHTVSSEYIYFIFSEQIS